VWVVRLDWSVEKEGRHVGGMGLRDKGGKGGKWVNGERRGEASTERRGLRRIGVCCLCARFVGCLIPLVV
jgi:hypothetical protein